MRAEIPEFKRSFFCIPLRYGIVFWGYVRLIDVVLSIYFKVVELDGMTGTKDANYIITWIIIVLNSIDFIFIVIFIVGAHKKNVLLLKIYYYYNIGEFVIQVLMLIALIIFFIYLYHILYVHDVADFHPSSTSYGLVKAVAVLSVFLLLQGYVLLLVRSEIKKLSSNCQFRFVNNAADSKCVIQLDEGSETGKGMKNEEKEIKSNEEGTSDLYGKPRGMLLDIYQPD